MKPALIDTSCIVALLDKSEKKHKLCEGAISQVTRPLVTCEAVLAEACYLLRACNGAQDAILANVEQGIIQVQFCLDEGASKIRALMKKYRSLPMDFADACLVYLAESLETEYILTLDKDFEVYRIRGKGVFENLLET